MTSFETREIIARDDFIRTADTIIENCRSADYNIEQTLTQAQGLSARITDIESGQLTVDPPLDENVVTKYRDAASAIIDVASKASAGLASTPKPKRKRLSGRGTDAKS